jgi:HlyD family secretion protein
MDRTSRKHLAPVSTPGASAEAGGMDRALPRRRFPRRRLAVAAVAAASALAVVLVARSWPERAVAVGGDDLVIAKVMRGRFDDFIQIRARAVPAHTVFIDTAQGGMVEAIHVQDGAMVHKGQLLLELSNTTLQLDVISREAQITEQLNNLRTLELAHEQNRLANDREMVEVSYHIARLGRQLARSEKLATSGVVPQAEQEDMREELAYYRKRRQVQMVSFRAADRLQRAQLVLRRAAATSLDKNLAVARHNLDGLKVVAPAAGQLSAFLLEIGQSLQPGVRLGQIDDPSRYKLTAEIDEFYLSRVDVGQRADYQLDGRSYRLEVARIRPQVQNGRFEADLAFEGASPPDVRRGQTAQLRLQLGQPSEAILVPNAAFYSDTGGAWVFVVSPDGDHAVRRKTRLGRRNPQYIEVLDGLRPGEEIVASTYDNYLDTDRLELTR